jgi:inosine-uridine nucleoside N-ribohydrolase
MAEKILLDTDIGSDIDDAVCLAYLLAQPACELVGVTTVSGESVKRAMMVDALCQVAGKAVPIYPGIEKPLFIDAHQPEAPQAAKLSNWPHNTDFPKGEAIDFMRRVIRENPGEITLLAIGPLTNVGLLFAVDPEIPELLKELVIMGGRFANRLADIPDVEWNILNDPHAAALVFNSPVEIRAVGLEATHQVTMDPAAVRAQFEAPLLQPVRDFAEVWFERVGRLIFHDPLAALTIFDDDICEFERGHVDVELAATPRLQGFTHWTPGEGRHQVAVSVKGDRFFDRFFAVFA